LLLAFVVFSCEEENALPSESPDLRTLDEIVNSPQATDLPGEKEYRVTSAEIGNILGGQFNSKEGVEMAVREFNDLLFSKVEELDPDFNPNTDDNGQAFTMVFNYRLTSIAFQGDPIDFNNFEVHVKLDGGIIPNVRPAFGRVQQRFFDPSEYSLITSFTDINDNLGQGSTLDKSDSSVDKPPCTGNNKVWATFNFVCWNGQSFGSTGSSVSCTNGAAVFQTPCVPKF
ncbi:MAG: hypothetical protein AAFY76_18105, partial [Cyanobacteria bacterium J06649_11]